MVAQKFGNFDRWVRIGTCFGSMRFPRAKQAAGTPRKIGKAPVLPQLTRFTNDFLIAQ